jgi:tRNA modification GTPase
VDVVLVGAPNVGKSSLLNALAGEDAAIVTEHPGTTRDRIERTVDIGGIAFNIIDTAGLRHTRDPVEAIGIERTLAAAAGADLVVELCDDRQPGTPSFAPLEAQLAAHSVRLCAHNKIDLSGAAPGVREGVVYLSARTGAGLADLRARLMELVGWDAGASMETVFLARARHVQALDRAAGHMESAHAHGSAGAARLELFAEELRLAAQALGEITGTVSSDDLLGEIFGRFCIGK